MTALPDVPANTTRLYAHFSGIKNLTVVHLLKNLTSLNLRWNDIETVDWMSLRNLPALEFLHLSDNKLTSVSLDVVIVYLPHLMYVNLAKNRLKSFTSQDLGFPRLTTASVEDNPLACDCAMTWLITKVKCMEADSREGTFVPCSQCPHCLLVAKDHDTSYVCASPSRLKGLPLLKVSENETECDAQMTEMTATTAGATFRTERSGREATSTARAVERRSLQTVKSFMHLYFPNSTALPNLPQATFTGTTEEAASSSFTSGEPTSSCSKPWPATDHEVVVIDHDTINTTSKPRLNGHYIVVITSGISLASMVVLTCMIRKLCPNHGSDDIDNTVATNYDIPLQQIH
ncbi:leucine-rich repeat and immunoglobulin-like domain-containing nogo receptor-interacting protein 2 [Branchiostoma lanceolatum]|uniref:leucine-rich repeat and immunoglobulin-like domain-containing nogo receptor-interacting protein 2 n=1 Tax=Branchiostoma lanceolatum TaxID=7740 RepID=UPI0034551BB6